MKHLYFFILGFILLILSSSVEAQIIVDGQERFGNEWINYDQEYYKFEVREDGLYRISKSALENAGFPVNTAPMSDFQMFWLGEEVAIYTTTEGVMGDDDFVEFYGKKVRSELDQYLFVNPDDEMLNPDITMHYSVSAYFLTHNSDNHLRVTSVENDLSGTLPAPLAWHWYDTEITDHINAYVKSLVRNKFYRYSDFDSGEGLGKKSNRIENNINLSVNNLYDNNNVPAKLSFRFAGIYDYPNHVLDISWNDNLIQSETSTRNQLLKIGIDIPLTELRQTNTLTTKGSDIIIGEGGANPITDRSAIGQIRMKYPRAFDGNNTNQLVFSIDPSETDPYIELNDFSSDSEPVIYDLDSNRRLLANIDNGKIKFRLRNGSVNSSYYLAASEAIKSVNEIRQFRFTDFTQNDANYLIISHKNLFNDGLGNNMVQEYAAYRSSDEGGNFKVAIIEVQDLMDQFIYGNAYHPFGVKNFINYISDKWNDLEFVLLMGKGLKNSEIFENQDDFTSKNLVPSYGSPASDVTLVSNGFSIAPNYIVGRLPVTNPAQVLDYLNKLKSFESEINDAPQTLEDRLWQKRVLHLSGGNLGTNGSTAQREGILNTMNNWKASIEGEEFGGDVFTHPFGSNEDVVDIPLTSQSFNLINEEGIIMKTYYGHGSAQHIQFGNIENPEFLSNKDRYPIMTALGCYTGDCYNIGFESLGEENILAKDKGAIAYIAGSGVGSTGTIPIFGQTWYDFLGGEHFGQSVGGAVKKTIEETVPTGRGNYYLLLQELIYLGDPAIKLNTFEAPDFITDYSSVTTEPSIVNTTDNTYDISFDVYNIGSVTSDSLKIQIVHQLPDGTNTEPVLVKIKSPHYSEHVTVSLENQGDKSAGFNKIFISLDPSNEINELPNPEAESNNELRSDIGALSFDFFVIAGGVRQIDPPEFAIVNNLAQFKLSASTLDALAPEETYLMEIDTTAFFNSPIKERTSITQSGGLVQWIPSMSLQDGTVYYWRTSQDSTAVTRGYDWHNSSFTYLPNEDDGWNQGHYFQYLENNLDSIVLRDDRQFELLPERTDVFEFNLAVSAEGPWAYNNGIPTNTLNPTNLGSAICVRIRHPQLRAIRRSVFGDFGSLGTSNGLYVYKMDKLEDRENLIKLLDAIPNESTVIIYTILLDDQADFHSDEWADDSQVLGQNLFDVLESFGATKTRLLENTGTVPYLLSFEKGGDVLVEEIGTNIDDTVMGTFQAHIIGDDGVIKSTSIGPASSWNRVEWSLDEYDLIGDITKLDIYLLSQDLTQTYYKTIEYPDERTDLSEISATTYPYILLEYRSNDSDDTLRVPARINYLRVLYDGLAEAAVNPHKHFTFYADSLQQGEILKLETTVENIRSTDFDKLDIRYIIQQDQSANRVIEKVGEPLGAHSQAIDTFNFETDELNGSYQLIMQINPEDTPVEQYRYNNFLFKSFYVSADKIKPLLDVTFDGMHILDGDLVSSQPLIDIRLTDENEFFLLDDTSSFQMSYIFPNGNTVPIYFSDDEVEFIAATHSDNNEARVKVEHEYLEDGIYTLLINGKDRRGNISGEAAYKTTFEVITTRAISKIMNYPNPFSTKTQFVYTLTGDSSPEFYKIQIMSAAGKIIREITQEEMGPLKVGRHKTDYTWDGTDEYGDQLANGVYLYRLIIQNNDLDPFEHFNTGADNYFKKDFGKLVILR